MRVSCKCLAGEGHRFNLAFVLQVRVLGVGLGVRVSCKCLAGCGHKFNLGFVLQVRVLGVGVCGGWVMCVGSFFEGCMSLPIPPPC